MSSSDETRTKLPDADVFFAALAGALRMAIKQEGFTSTLKSLKKGRLPASGLMMTVQEGVIEERPSGLYDAALQTERGPVLLRGAQRADRDTTDIQSVSSGRTPSHDTPVGTLTPDQLLRQLADARVSSPPSLVCEVELVCFNEAQGQQLLPLLWQYILRHRNSNDRNALIAVGSAIRKYIAIMPMGRMGDLAVLLESGNRSPLPVELEIEVAKMIYRNFEVHPPPHPDPHPELAQRLWEIVQAYIHPRVLLRSRNSAAASLAIEAIVAMRSALAEPAWTAAVTCPYRWFAELVNDDLDSLRQRWSDKNPDAAAWLATLQDKIAAHV